MLPVSGGKRLEGDSGVEHEMAKRRRFSDDDGDEDATSVMDAARESMHDHQEETSLDARSPGTPGGKDIHSPAEEYLGSSALQHASMQPLSSTVAIGMGDNAVNSSRLHLGMSDDSLHRAAREMRDAALETNAFVKSLCVDMRTVMKEMATISELKRNFAEFKSTIVQLLGNAPTLPDAMAAAAPVLQESNSDIRQVVKECPKWKVYTERLRFNCLDSMSEERLRRFVRPTAAELLADIVGRGKFSEADVELVVGLLRTSLTGTRQNYKKYIRVYIRDHYVGNGAIDRPPQEEHVRAIVTWLLSRLYKGISERELWSKAELIEDMRKLVLSEWAHADRVKECRLQLSMVGGSSVGGAIASAGGGSDSHAEALMAPPPPLPPTIASAASMQRQQHVPPHHASDTTDIMSSSPGEHRDGGARLAGHAGAGAETETETEIHASPGQSPTTSLGIDAGHPGDVSPARDGMEDAGEGSAMERVAAGALGHGHSLVNGT
eukprot:jgi/Mesvir1/17972/Mv09864-RA.1